MSVISTIVGIGRMRQAQEKEAEREAVASWYITVPGIPEGERNRIEKSLRYNLGRSFIRLSVALFVLMLLWAFGFMMNFDPYEDATGYKLIGRKEVTAVVQEDGLTATLKDPNQGEHVIYPLTELGLDVTGYSYGNRINTYWKWNEDSGDYTFLVALPEERANQIDYAYYAIGLSSLFVIIIGSVAVFFIRRRIYTGWFAGFYYRIEKFCSEYGVRQMYPNQDMLEAFVSYGSAHPSQFAAEFNAVQLTKEELKAKRRSIIIAVVISIATAAAIIIGIAFFVGIQSTRESIENEARTSAVAAQAQAACDDQMEALGESSDYYNLADMMTQARDSFPGEDVYYKITTTEEYVAVVITTARKKNVYFDRYVPVKGAVGDEDTVYKLETSMVSDVIQPDDILQNYTGIIAASDTEKR